MHQDYVYRGNGFEDITNCIEKNTDKKCVQHGIMNDGQDGLFLAIVKIKVRYVFGSELRGNNNNEKELHGIKIRQNTKKDIVEIMENNDIK